MPYIRIERVQNGYTVCATDPKVVEANRKRDGGSDYRWTDPEREYVFKSISEAVKFVEAIAEKALPLEPAPPDTFASAFDAAVADDGDGDE